MSDYKEIKLLKNNEGRDWSDLEWIEEFFKFLQGELPEGIHISRGHQPKLSAKKAMTIIWYLQEKFPILPDHIEQCWECGDLFDSHKEGVYWEAKERNYCGMCKDDVPQRVRNK